MDSPAAIIAMADQRSLSGSFDRRRVSHSPLGLVEDLRCAPETNANGPRDGFSPEYQVCFPYAGFFTWHVGGDDVAADANQVLFVRGGESYRLSQPGVGGRYGELIVTPSRALLAELLGTPEARLSSHPLFHRRYARAGVASQLLGARVRGLRSGAGGTDPLEADELVVALLRSAVATASAISITPGPATARLIRRAKEFLEANLSRRVYLDDVAAAAGASPAYVTSAFRRFEGIPLHRYALHLRLARALTELPHANDLTTLALGLGFSSHSHFTAAFKGVFGCTPSRYRRLLPGNPGSVT